MKRNRRSLHCATPDSHFIGNKSRVPHISLVFREMWDSTALNPKAFGSLSTLKIWICGIPHLAKNERDVAHPGFCCRGSKQMWSVA
jgi:hypothetical protein